MPGQSKWGGTALGGAAAAVFVGFGLLGCGGAVQFSGATPFEVAGTSPAPTPEPKSERVVVTEDAIVINDKIQFELDKATIKSESHGLLDEIVQVINDNPQIEKLSIEGHTCDLGAEAYNETLSGKRAAAVRTYLTEHGVSGERLTSVGRGEARPLVENTDEAARERNRRVEFLITSQRKIETVYEVDKATGERKLVSTNKPSKAPEAQPDATPDKAESGVDAAAKAPEAEESQP